MNIVKPAVIHSLDRLEENDLVRRKTDPQDRRSVLVTRTAAGQAFVRELKTLMAKTAGEVERATPRSE